MNWVGTPHSFNSLPLDMGRRVEAVSSKYWEHMFIATSQYKYVFQKVIDKQQKRSDVCQLGRHSDVTKCVRWSKPSYDCTEHCDTSPVRQQSVTQHFEAETENESLWSTTNIIRRRCGVSDFGADIQVSLAITVTTIHAFATVSGGGVAGQGVSWPQCRGSRLYLWAPSNPWQEHFFLPKSQNEPKCRFLTKHLQTFSEGAIRDPHNERGPSNTISRPSRSFLPPPNIFDAPPSLVWMRRERTLSAVASHPSSRAATWPRHVVTASIIGTSTSLLTSDSVVAGRTACQHITTTNSLPSHFTDNSLSQTIKRRL